MTAIYRAELGPVLLGERSDIDDAMELCEQHDQHTLACMYEWNGADPDETVMAMWREYVADAGGYDKWHRTQTSYTVTRIEACPTCDGTGGDHQIGCKP